MFYRDLRVFIYFVTIFYYVNCKILIKRNDKRLEDANSYEVCLDNFAIHKDRIIKTHDSRDRGATYLNVITVNSREECLKFCCDTDKCDVFIFEEKEHGSCYLFQCGPLNKFKCTFTNHANYTSAVRTDFNVQNSALLEENIRISQQEHELKSLRKAPDIAGVQYSITEHSAKLVVTPAPKFQPTTPTVLKQRGCSRNQYECRSSGDCIAIYNVCDGIPQCPDGSDEAAELTCPTEKSTIPSLMAIQGPQVLLPADIIKYRQMIDQRKSYQPIYSHDLENNPKPWEPPNFSQRLPPSQNFLYPVRQMDISQLHKDFGSAGYQWDYPPQQNRDIYSANSFHEQNNFNPYDQNQPHIFSHKGPGVIGGDSETDSGTYLNPKHTYLSHFPLPNKEAWLETQQVQLSSPMPPNLQNKEESSKNIKTTLPPPCDTSIKHDNVLPENTESKARKDEKLQTNIFYEKTRKTETLTSNVLKQSAVPTNESKALSQFVDRKRVIVLEHRAKEHERNGVVAEHLQQINENEILKPKGAVISLALGLTATAITAALIACRLRVVKRRGRRGHGSYAHDADYLVNGMYL